MDNDPNDKCEVSVEYVYQLKETIKQLRQYLYSQYHYSRKAMLEVKAELEFYRTRADYNESKHKASIKYKNEYEQLKKILNELDERLSSKEDEMLELMKKGQEMKRKLGQLEDEKEYLIQMNGDLYQKLVQIKEAALGAIMEKDTLIGEMTEKLEYYYRNDNRSDLKEALMQMAEKCHELESNLYSGQAEYEANLNSKDEYIGELQYRINKLLYKQDYRVVRLEQYVQDYYKHIERINEYKYNEENLEEKYYLIEDKLRKAEKKLHEVENELAEYKIEHALIVKEMEKENEHSKRLTYEMKELRMRVKEADNYNKTKKKELEETKTTLEYLGKKVQELYGEKRTINDNLEQKVQQLYRLHIEAYYLKLSKSTKNKQPRDKERSSLALDAQSKKYDDINADKLRKQVKQLEDNVAYMSKKFEYQTKELQETRQKLLETSGSGGVSSNEEKLLLQIENLNFHIKKVENLFMINKLRHAEDEGYWSRKEKQYKDEIEAGQKQFKREKSYLLYRIDRMKKNSNKDKKMDYYQSAFK